MYQVLIWIRGQYTQYICVLHMCTELMCGKNIILVSKSFLSDITAGGGGGGGVKLVSGAQLVNLLGRC